MAFLNNNKKRRKLFFLLMESIAAFIQQTCTVEREFEKKVFAHNQNLQSPRFRKVTKEVGKLSKI